MNRTALLLIVASVLMSALAQIVLKAGMTNSSVAQSLASGVRWSSVAVVAGNPLVLLGLAMYFASALVWLIVLARVDVSLAYPFVGLGFIVTMLLGWLVHGEALTLVRVAGTLLIVGGVVLLATRG